MTTTFFDDQLLTDYMKAFYGYGRYGGDYWFIGMEEGGGNSFANIAQRLEDWNRRGRLELEDLVAYHEKIGSERFFGTQPKLQPTWNRLIRMELSAKGQDVETEQVRAYQKNYLGRHTSSNCLLELLPLPSPSVGHWLYVNHSRNPHLMSRETYTSYYAPRRAAHLHQRILAYKPKAVIFYSVNPVYMSWWKQIASVDFIQERANDHFYMGKSQHTVFAITRHPVTQGIKNDYFHQVGKRIAFTLASL